MFPELMRDDVFQLETQRLWLRWPRATDSGVIAQLAGERDVAQMTGNIPHPYPPGAAAEFVLKARAANLGGEDLTLVIARKERPVEAIGCIRLHKAGAREAVLGYWLGKPHWRQGLASEAACALIDMAFRTTNVAVITATVRTGNRRSQNVLDFCGFRAAGQGVRAAPARGGAVPVDRFQLRRADWVGAGAASDFPSAARMMQSA